MCHWTMSDYRYNPIHTKINSALGAFLTATLPILHVTIIGYVGSVRKFHSGRCTDPQKCIHCFGPHSSNSRNCPEYSRQKNIKDRMTHMREDIIRASQFFPIRYKTQKFNNRTQVGLTYAQATISRIPHFLQKQPINTIHHLSANCVNYMMSLIVTEKSTRMHYNC